MENKAYVAQRAKCLHRNHVPHPGMATHLALLQAPVRTPAHHHSDWGDEQEPRPFCHVRWVRRPKGLTAELEEYPWGYKGLLRQYKDLTFSSQLNRRPQGDSDLDLRGVSSLLFTSSSNTVQALSHTQRLFPSISSSPRSLKLTICSEATSCRTWAASASTLRPH